MMLKWRSLVSDQNMKLEGVIRRLQTFTLAQKQRVLLQSPIVHRLPRAPPKMESSGDSHLQPHLALFPSAGMGHITPFLRLAKMLMNHHCRITLITTLPTVSTPESLLISRFLSSFPQVGQLQLNLLPSDTSTANSDPFFRQMEAIRHSTHLLSPLLNQVSPPITAFISDTFTIAPSLLVSSCLQVPNFVLFTSSARMFSLFSYFPTIEFSKTSDGSNGISGFVEIPGIPSIPMASIPPWLLNSETFFAILFKKDGEKVRELDGILINTFGGLEEESLTALNTRQVLNGLPHVFPLGPFVPCEFEIGERRELLNWLDDQPKQSVVFLSFGSRTALSKDQIREVGNGVVASGYRFLWVVKTKKVTSKDEEEEEEEEEGLSNLVGEDFKERVKGKGIVVRRWVDQEQILAHRSIGGFVSHCGWNSIVEAAWNGVPVLAWPQHGDQKINAEVAEKKGFGMWERSWGWSNERVVGGEEIGERIKEMMASEELKMKAAEVREEARKAKEVGGSCEKVMEELTQIWNNCKSSSNL